MSILASPITLPSGATLPNRFAKAAMSEVLADRETGAPTDALIRLYERWGRSGAGLLITGNVMVDPGGRGEPGNVVVTDRRHLTELARWATAAQAHGAHLWMQLNHAGRQSPRRLAREPVAPSAVPMQGFAGMFARPRALTEPEILAIIARFATAAAVAKEAGFAGVQLHAAHGYLISQFLSPLTNRRTDAWGGDAARRTRFLLELVRAIRAAVGPAFPIGVKLNSADFQRGGFTIDEAMDVARALTDIERSDAAGARSDAQRRGGSIDLLEVSGGTYESPAMAGVEERQSTREREAYFLDYARQIRAVTAVPIMLTGGMRSRAVMDDALASGAIDVVGLARPMTYTPDLPAHLLDGSLAEAPSVHIRSRVKAIDAALQVAWFQTQIHELARGREPDLALSRTAALWRAFRASFNPFARDRFAATPAEATA